VLMEIQTLAARLARETNDSVTRVAIDPFGRRFAGRGVAADNPDQTRKKKETRDSHELFRSDFERPDKVARPVLRQRHDQPIVVASELQCAIAAEQFDLRDILRIMFAALRETLDQDLSIFRPGEHERE